MEQQKGRPRSGAKVAKLLPVYLSCKFIDLHSSLEDNRFPNSGTQIKCYRLCSFQLRGSSKKTPQLFAFLSLIFPQSSLKKWKYKKPQGNTDFSSFSPLRY